MEHESAVCRCPVCGNRFEVLADEYGDHPCPKCGYWEDEEEEPEVFYVEWLNEDDIDEHTFGGAVAMETRIEDVAIGIASRLTNEGHPCQVTNQYQDVIWYPEEGGE